MLNNNTFLHKSINLKCQCCYKIYYVLNVYHLNSQVNTDKLNYDISDTTYIYNIL